jgi:ABC-type transporter Mla subunit MlaD
MASQEKPRPVNVQQVLLFHETRLKNVDETLKELVDFKDSQTENESLKEQRDSNVIKTMAMNQNNFNKTLQEFSERISKVQDLFIDIQHELKNLKQENVVVSTSQERKPKVEEPEVEEPKKEDETSKEVSLTITEKEEPKKEDEKKEEEVNK